MTKMTIILRRQLRKAVIDHISDSFLETNLPLENLIEAAKHGVEEKRYVFIYNIVILRTNENYETISS